jgi:hypothetical protein
MFRPLIGPDNNDATASSLRSRCSAVRVRHPVNPHRRAADLFAIFTARHRRRDCRRFEYQPDDDRQGAIRARHSGDLRHCPPASRRDDGSVALAEAWSRGQVSADRAYPQRRHRQAADDCARDQRSDLLEDLRLENVEDPAEVSLAILEGDGGISVVKKKG